MDGDDARTKSSFFFFWGEHPMISNLENVESIPLLLLETFTEVENAEGQGDGIERDRTNMDYNDETWLDFNSETMGVFKW